MRHTKLPSLVVMGVALSGLVVGCSEIKDEKEPVVQESTQETEQVESEENKTTENIEKEEVEENDEKEIIKANSNLSKNIAILDLAYKNENIMLSPTSLNVALGMVTNGADAETLAELENFLGCSIDEYNEFVKGYTEKMEDGVNVVNAVWVNEDFTLKEDFYNLLTQYYNATHESLDFTSSESVNKINNWVNKNTDGRIEKILNEIPDDSRTILTNVVDFDKKWKEPFEEFQIIDGKFNNEKNVTYLSDNTRCSYYENDYAIGFARDYEGDRYSFIGILPKQEGEFNISDLDIEGLLKTKAIEKVDYKFPEFEFEFESSLRDYLKQLGIKKAFGDDANFTKILEEQEGYFISEVFQKTKVIVNREGTKASAATSIIVSTNSALDLPKQVYLDRPFVFIVYDNETEECLFIGKVVNP